MNSSEKKLETAEALLGVAEKLFTEKGYDAVSTRELADAAGVNLGAIQYHYGSKAKLFVAMVHRLMEQRGPSALLSAIEGEADSKKSAAKKLVGHIHAHLAYLLDPDGPKACKMMCREVLGAKGDEEEMIEALLSSVVENYIRPSHEKLVGLVALIKPDAPKKKLDHFVQSIIAQASFYVTHGPFVERLHDIDLTSETEIKSIAEDIAEFSLRALGLKDAEITAAIEEAKNAY